MEAFDPGVGVNALTVTSGGKQAGNEQTNVEGACAGAQCTECWMKRCPNGQEAQPVGFWLGPALPEGEDALTVKATDSTGMAAESLKTLRYDNAPPHSLEITGLPEGKQLGEGVYQITGKATDGEGSTPSSGVASLELTIDGRRVGSPAGSCSLGPCTATSSWTIRGSEYAAGQHTVNLVVTDHAGNVASSSVTVMIGYANRIPVGAGAVDPDSGAFTLQTADASLGGGLTVSRDYNSQHPTAGGFGPLGPQWTLGTGSRTQLEVLPNGSVVLSETSGAQAIFTVVSGGFSSPPGDSNLVLSKKSSSTYAVEDAATGAKTIFEELAGGRSGVLVPVRQEGLVATQTVSYVYAAVKVGEKTLIEPVEELAPVLAGVTCTLELKGEEPAKVLKRGCRALTFNYATSTTATGEEESQWGDYEGNLTRVYYTAWSDTANEMKTVEVVHYLYDKQGRLRTEWDPRVAGELKTFYGYDAEGHVTALTPPGQESWAFTYGGIAADPSSTGRLLKVMQAPASVALWRGAPLSSSAAPKLSGEAIVGQLLGVSTGKWNGNPVAYSYQWQRCNSAGKECAPIAGATNPTYRLTGSDAEHTLVASVTATNGDGSIISLSSASSTVARADFVTHKVGSEPGLRNICVGPDGNLWFTEYTTGKVGKITTGGSVTEYALPAGSKPDGIAAGSDGNLWFTDEGTSKVGKITTSGSITEYALPSGSAPKGIVGGGDGNLWFSDYGSSKVGKITTSGTVTAYALPAGSKPDSIAAGSDGNLWFTDEGTSKVGKITTSGSVTEYGLPAGSHPANDIAAGADGNLWYTRSPSKTIGKITTSGAIVEYPLGMEASSVAAGPEGNMWYAGFFGVGKVTATGEDTMYSELLGNTSGIVAGPDGNMWFTSEALGSSFIDVLKIAKAKVEEEFSSGTGSHPQGVVESSDGNLWFVDEGTSKIGKRNTSTGSISEYALPVESDPYGIAKGSDGNLWFTDSHTNKVGKITTSGSITEYALPSGSTPKGIVGGGDGNLWFTDYASSKVGKITTSGSVTEYALPSGSKPLGIAAGSDGNLWFTDEGTSKVGKITTSGTVTEYALPSGNRPIGIAAGPDGNLWFTENELLVNSKVEKITTSGVITGYALPTGSTPEGIAVGPDGNMWFAEAGSALSKVENNIGRISMLGVVSQYALPSESEPHDIATGPEDDLWFADYKTAKVGKINTSIEPTEPPQPGTTIEYDVPVSGTGAPYAMGIKEIEAWGQKDLPQRATAIFPPDEPQGWPATDYKKATVYYLDEKSRTVNVATSGGGIATSEYNADNDVVRTLSPRSRAAALVESCENKEKCKSAEVAGHLATLSEYNEEGTELLGTLGPEHLVKLENGKETQAHSHTVYHYDEGAPAKGGPYRLETKTTQGVDVTGEPEQDLRTTVTSYSGQNGLGWMLRQPTSVTVDPNSLKLVRTTIYNPATGEVSETRSPAAGLAEEAHPSGYVSQWGSYDKGNLGLDKPRDVTVDPKGDAWVADTADDRVLEISPTGELIRVFGGKGSGNGQFKEPEGISLDAEGNVWVADTENSRVQKFSSTGAYITQFKITGGLLPWPVGVAVDHEGHVWVTEIEDKVQEFTATGESLRSFGSEGTGTGQFKGPRGIAFDKEGHVWVADTGNGRLQEFSSTGGYLAQHAVEAPHGIAIDSSGNEWVTRAASVEEMSATGTVLKTFGAEGTGNGQFKEPRGIELDGEGHVWLADSGNSRVQELSGVGSYIRAYPVLAAAMQFAHPKGVAVDPSGDVWVADSENGRVQEVSPSGSFIAQLSQTLVKPEGIAISVSGSSTGVWVTDAATDTASKYASNGSLLESFGAEGTGTGQFKEPAGIAVSGEELYVVDRGNDRVQEFNARHEYLRQFGSVGSGSGQLKEPQGIAIDAKGDVWVADAGNNRIEEFSSEGAYIASYGTLGSGNGQFNKPQGLGFDTEGNIWVADTGNSRVQELSSTGVYIQQFAKEGTGTEQLEKPTDLALDSSNHVYVLDTGNSRVEKWISPSLLHESAGTGGVHGTQTIYYSAEADSEHPECGLRPEWAELACRTQPAAQPKTEGLPNLPVTTTVYNMYGEPETTTSTVGSSTRTSKVGYDNAGRPITTEETSTVGKPLPAVTNVYSESTGALVEQKATEGTETKAIKSIFNNLGQLTSYTDASGAITTYEYEKEGDMRLEKVTEPHGNQSYAYDPTTGDMDRLTDSAAGVFEAAYDVEGNMVSETYPNGMIACYSYSHSGEQTALTYYKSRACGEGAVWFTDSRRSRPPMASGPPRPAASAKIPISTTPPVGPSKPPRPRRARAASRAAMDMTKKRTD